MNPFEVIYRSGANSRAIDTFRNKAHKEWLDDGIRHLDVLCKEAQELADEGDIVPSAKSKTAAIELMKEFCHAPAPHIAVTTNGDIVLTWENNGESFKVFVSSLGTYQLFKNKTKIDKPAFAKNVIAVPA